MNVRGLTCWCDNKIKFLPKYYLKPGLYLWTWKHKINATQTWSSQDGHFCVGIIWVGYSLQSGIYPCFVLFCFAFIFFVVFTFDIDTTIISSLSSWYWWLTESFQALHFVKLTWEKLSPLSGWHCSSTFSTAPVFFLILSASWARYRSSTGTPRVLMSASVKEFTISITQTGRFLSQFPAMALKR